MMTMMPAGQSLASAGDRSEELLRIGDVARQFDVTLRTLRFYEDKGLITPLREGNARLYAHRDIARLKLILFGRRVGFTLREVKQLLDLYDPNGSNHRQMKTLLDRSERQLRRLEKERVELEQAICELKSTMSGWRASLQDAPKSGSSN